MVNLTVAITYSWAGKSFKIFNLKTFIKIISLKTKDPADRLLFKSTSAIIGLSVISVVSIR